MGGQACVLYGAAEFSRDVDLAVVAQPDDLARLRLALGELEAGVIAIPPFDVDYLDRGHAVHFRCAREDVRGLRIDIMSRMRGVDSFQALWDRRTSMEVPGDAELKLIVDALSLPDLVAAKKTQRDKDWPMIRRLVDVNYFAFRETATAVRVQFWLRELRTPQLLMECASAFPAEAQSVAPERSAVGAAMERDIPKIEGLLADEQTAERERDRAYWAPLRAELERLRKANRPSSA